MAQFEHVLTRKRHGDIGLLPDIFPEHWEHPPETIETFPSHKGAFLSQGGAPNHPWPTMTSY